MISKTLSPDNQLRIKCPIFHAETRIAACLVLRDAVFRGDQVTTRQGCQCAISASKCPIPQIVKDMVRDNSDPYHSAEPKLGTLDSALLDRIRPVLIPDFFQKKYALSPQELKAIQVANDDAKNGVRSTGRTSIVLEEIARRERDAAPPIAPATPSPTSDLVKAASSGDMSAAINAESGS